MPTPLARFAPEVLKRPLRPYLGGHARHLRRASRHFRSAWPVIGATDGWISMYEAEVLFALAELVPPGQAIVEIGSYKGRSTITMAAAAPTGVPIYAVDPHTGDRTQVDAGQVVDTWDEFRANLSRAKLTSVIPVRLRSVEAAASYDGPDVAMLFIDGWHSTDAVIADFESWQPYLAGTATIVFDDRAYAEIAIAIDALRDRLPSSVGTVQKFEVFAGDLPRSVTRLLR